MFDQFKKIAQLKKLQGEMKKEKITGEENGIEVIMNGNFEIEDIKLNPELSVEAQQDSLKRCLNKTREDIQKKMAKIMMDSGIGL